jgi:formyltetrahydrofolate deformylase
MSEDVKPYILLMSCQDTVGIVAAVSGFLSQNKAFIAESSQYSDLDTNRFFMRIVFLPDAANVTLSTYREKFAEVGKRFSMDWSMHDASQKARLLVMVSKFDHCLNDLLYRYRTGALPVEIAGVVSNHPDLESVVRWHDIPFHHLPVSDNNRAAQEKQIMELVKDQNIDLVVLARYMQVLSTETCKALAGRAINIHHSFLPGFKGANPYEQAHKRGVKLIGATAHYVTPDLDEGPIIEQEVQRIDHTRTTDQLRAIGRDIENIVLARAVLYHIEHRVFINGRKTVVFR